MKVGGQVHSESGGPSGKRQGSAFPASALKKRER